MILKHIVCEDVDENQVLLIPPPNGHTMTFFGAWAIIVNLILTYDHNYLPGKLGCGILQSATVGFVVFAINTLSYLVYMRCWRFGHDSSYAGLWKSLIGKSSMWIPRVMIIIGYIYFVVEFVCAMTNDIKIILEYCNIKDISDVTISYAISLLTFIFFGPFPDVSVFVRHSIVSLFSCLAIISIAVYVLYTKYQYTGLPKNLSWWNPSFYSLEAASIYSIDIFMHPFNHAIYSRLEKPSLKRMNYNGILIQVFVTFWIFILGTIGYITFPNNNSSDPIYWKYSKNLKLIASIPNFINSFTTNGVIVNLIQREMVDLFLEGTSNKNTAIIPAAVLLLFIGGSLVLWPINLRSNVKILGDVINCFLSYILPYIFYIKMKEKMTACEKAVITILSLLGITLTGFLLYVDYVRLMQTL